MSYFRYYSKYYSLLEVIKINLQIFRKKKSQEILKMTDKSPETTNDPAPDSLLTKRSDVAEKSEKPQTTTPRRKRSSQQPESVEQVLSRISNDFTDVQPLEYISRMLKVHPAYVILGTFVVLFLPIILGLWPSFFVNLLGFLYPGYMTIKTAGNQDREALKQWLSYWLTFGFMELIDGLLILIFLYFLPFFYPIKALFLIWLFYPKSKGASFLYEKAFRRLYQKIKSLKDDEVVDMKAEDFFKGNSKE